MVPFCSTLRIVANDLQDFSLLILIFFPCSLLPYTLVGLVSFLSSPPNTPVLANAISLLIGQALASLAGSPAAVAPSKVSVPVLLSCRS